MSYIRFLTMVAALLGTTLDAKSADSVTPFYFPIDLKLGSSYRCQEHDLILPSSSKDPDHNWAYSRSILTSTDSAENSDEIPRALNLLSAGHPDESLDVVDRLIKLSPRAHLFLFRAWLNYSIGKREDALRDLNDALGKGIDATDRVVICHLFILLQSFDKADQLLQQVIAEDRKCFNNIDATAHYLLLCAEIHLGKKQYSQALDALLRAECIYSSIGDAKGSEFVRVFIEREKRHFPSNQSTQKHPLPSKGKSALLAKLRKFKQNDFPLEVNRITEILGTNIDSEPHYKIDDQLKIRALGSNPFKRSDISGFPPGIKYCGIKKAIHVYPAETFTELTLIFDPIVCAVTNDELASVFSYDPKQVKQTFSNCGAVSFRLGDKEVNAIFDGAGFRSLRSLSVAGEKVPGVWAHSCPGSAWGDWVRPAFSDPQQALDYAESELANTPDSELAKREKVLNLLLLGRLTEADAFFRKWKAYSPGSKNLWEPEIRLLDAKKQFSEASNKLSEHLKLIESDHYSGFVKGLKIYLVELLLKGNNPQEALEKLKALPSNDPEVQLLTAKALMASNQRPLMAETLLNAAVKGFYRDTKIGKRDEALKLLRLIGEHSSESVSNANSPLESCSDNDILLLKKNK